MMYKLDKKLSWALCLIVVLVSLTSLHSVKGQAQLEKEISNTVLMAKIMRYVCNNSDKAIKLKTHQLALARISKLKEDGRLPQDFRIDELNRKINNLKDQVYATSEITQIVEMIKQDTSPLARKIVELFEREMQMARNMNRDEIQALVERSLRNLDQRGLISPRQDLSREIILDKEVRLSLNNLLVETVIEDHNYNLAKLFSFIQKFKNHNKRKRDSEELPGWSKMRKATYRQFAKKHRNLNKRVCIVLGIRDITVAQRIEGDIELLSGASSSNQEIVQLSIPALSDLGLTPTTLRQYGQAYLNSKNHMANLRDEIGLPSSQTKKIDQMKMVLLARQSETDFQTDGMTLEQLAQRIDFWSGYQPA